MLVRLYIFFENMILFSKDQSIYNTLIGKVFHLVISYFLNLKKKILTNQLFPDNS